MDYLFTFLAGLLTPVIVWGMGFGKYFIERSIENKKAHEETELLSKKLGLINKASGHNTEKILIDELLKKSDPQIYSALMKDFILKPQDTQNKITIENFLESTQIITIISLRLLWASRVNELLFENQELSKNPVYEKLIENKEFALLQIHTGYLLLTTSLKINICIDKGFVEFLESIIADIPLPSNSANRKAIDKIKSDLLINPQSDR